jgi:NAD(P)-dependent dehydrogenase (short-subunit alcohol dehydrogenase family)
VQTIKQLMDLSDSVAVITGGAGFLGRTMADALAELGCSICLIDRPGSELDSWSAKLRDQWRVKVTPLEVDLANESSRSAIPDLLAERFSKVNILINNAAFVGDSNLPGWAVPFLDQDIGTWRQALEVNLTASFHLAQLCTPMLRAAGNGSIINIGSIYGVLGPDNRLYEGTAMGNPGAYAASKGGLIQMTRWLSTILAPEIRVNCISPGGLSRGQPRPFLDRYIARTPLGRMGTEEDFKGAIIFFASSLSAWVTGQNLMIDGGWTAW